MVNQTIYTNRLAGNFAQVDNNRVTKADLQAIRELTQALAPLATIVTALISTTMGNQRHSSQAMMLPFILSHALNSHVLGHPASRIGNDGASLMEDTTEKQLPPARTLIERLNLKEEARVNAQKEEAAEKASAKAEVEAYAQKTGAKIDFGSGVSDKSIVSEQDQAKSQLEKLEKLIVKEQINELSGKEDTKTIRETSKRQRDAQLESDVITTMKDKPGFTMARTSEVSNMLKSQYSKLDSLQDAFHTTDDVDKKERIAAKTETLQAHIKSTLDRNGLGTLDSQDYSLRDAKIDAPDGQQKKYSWAKVTAAASGLGAIAMFGLRSAFFS